MTTIFEYTDDTVTAPVTVSLVRQDQGGRWAISLEESSDGADPDGFMVAVLGRDGLRQLHLACARELGMAEAVPAEEPGTFIRSDADGSMSVNTTRELNATEISLVVAAFRSPGEINVEMDERLARAQRQRDMIEERVRELTVERNELQDEVERLKTAAPGRTEQARDGDALWWQHFCGWVRAYPASKGPDPAWCPSCTTSGPWRPLLVATDAPQQDA